jgi:glutathione S-transferase
MRLRHSPTSPFVRKVLLLDDGTAPYDSPVICDYLDLRGGAGVWRDTRPALAAWYARFSERPSRQASAPPA